VSIAIYHAKGITTVYSPDGKVLIRADDSKAKKIPVPAGKVVPATYIYQDVLRSEITSFSFTTEKGETITTEEAEKIYGEKGELLYIVIWE
jgi:hypothetical protein